MVRTASENYKCVSITLNTAHIEITEQAPQHRDLTFSKIKNHNIRFWLLMLPSMASVTEGNELLCCISPAKELKFLENWKICGNASDAREEDRETCVNERLEK